VRGAKGRQPEVHLNLSVRGMMPSATLAIQERCRELTAAGMRVFRLGIGQSPFPVPRVVVEELQANAHQKDYLPVAGLPALREAVAGYHRRTQSLPCDAMDVLVGPGSKELMFLLQLCYYGDIVIPTPAWVSYAPQAHIIGRRIQWLPTLREDGWRLRPQSLERLCRREPERPRIVVLNYPANPTGGSYTLDELKELAQIARRFRVVLLADEIYGEIHHKGQHVSIARFYPEGTIVSSGLSKWCGAGGWRLGTFAFPRSMSWLREAMAAVASETFTSTSAPIQYAAIRAFHGGLAIEHYLWHSRRLLGALGRSCARRLMDAGAYVVKPAGGFYLFPDFEAFRERLEERGIRDAPTLCKRLLQETGVAILPGTDFGRGAEELTARIAYVDFDGARTLAALELHGHEATIDEAFLRQHCAAVLEAMDLLVDWLTA